MVKYVHDYLKGAVLAEVFQAAPIRLQKNRLRGRKALC